MLLAKAFTMNNLWTPSPARLRGYFLLFLNSQSLFSFSLLLPVMCPSYFSLYLLLIWIFWVPLRKRGGIQSGGWQGIIQRWSTSRVLARLPLLSIRLFLEFKNKHVIPSSPYWLNDQWRQISNPAERIMTDFLPYNKPVPFTRYCGNRTWSDDRLRSEDLDNSLVLMLTWYRTKNSLHLSEPSFPPLQIRYESWTMKKAEHWRIDAFELWCWRRLLRVPQTARRSNQSILKEINPEYSLEGLMLKLKLQDFGHLMWRANSLEKTLMLEKIEGRRRRG